MEQPARRCGVTLPPPYPERRAPVQADSFKDVPSDKVADIENLSATPTVFVQETREAAHPGSVGKIEHARRDRRAGSSRAQAGSEYLRTKARCNRGSTQVAALLQHQVEKPSDIKQASYSGKRGAGFSNARQADFSAARHSKLISAENNRVTRDGVLTSAKKNSFTFSDAANYLGYQSAVAGIPNRSVEPQREVSSKRSRQHCPHPLLQMREALPVTENKVTF